MTQQNDLGAIQVSGQTEMADGFQDWFDSHFLGPDGGRRHLPDWLEDELRSAWEAALRRPAPTEPDIRAALERLVAKLELIHDHPRFKAVWECAHFRLGAYDGPTYTQELADVLAALTASAPAGGWQDRLLERAISALDELTATVRGECPSLLNEDSGGNARLSIEIDAILTARDAGSDVTRADGKTGDARS